MSNLSLDELIDKISKFLGLEVHRHEIYTKSSLGPWCTCSILSPTNKILFEIELQKPSYSSGWLVYETYNITPDMQDALTLLHT